MPIPTLATGWVVGAVYHADPDSADLDRLAEAVVNVGTVTFTPVSGYHLPSTSQAVTHGTITAWLDAHGDLHVGRQPSDTTGTDTEDGISLPVGGYTVSYALNKGALPSHSIVVTEAHTVEAPLALFASMDSPSAPGTPGLTAANLAAALAVQQITLTAPLALTVPAGFPAGQVYRVTLTQDGVGGHTVTYGGDPVTVDLTAGAVTTVELQPAGAGYVVRYPAQVTTGIVDLDALGADPTGVEPIDAIWDAALAMLPVSAMPGSAGYPIGKITFGTGVYHVAGNLTNPGPRVYIEGQGCRATIIDHHGAGACFRIFSKWFETDGWAIPDENARGGGSISALMIDGANAAAGAIGLWYGDMTGFEHRIHVRNYAGAGSIGILQRQVIGWTEKCVGDSFVWNCSTAFEISGGYAPGSVTIVEDVTLPSPTVKISSLPDAWPHPYSSGLSPYLGNRPIIYVNGQSVYYQGWIDNPDGTVTLTGCAEGSGTLTAGSEVLNNSYHSSVEYNDMKIRIGCCEGQNGVVLSGGISYGGCRLRVFGNMFMSETVQECAALTLAGFGYPGGRVGTSQPTSMADTHLEIVVEAYGPGTHGPTTIKFGAQQHQIYRSYGMLRFDPAGDWTSAGLGISHPQLRFQGPVRGDVTINPSTQSLSAHNTAGSVIYTPGFGNGGDGQLNLNDGDVIYCELIPSTPQPCLLTFNTPNEGPQRKTIIFQQSWTGAAKAVTWPTSATPTVATPTVKWAGGVAPTLSTGNMAQDIFELVTRDGATWWGRVLGQDMT